MANKRKAMEEVPAPFTVDGTESSNSNAGYTDVYYTIGKKGYYSFNPKPKIQFPVKGKHAGKSMKPAGIAKLLLSPKMRVEKVSKDSKGLYVVLESNGSTVPFGFINNGGQKISADELPAIKKLAKQHFALKVEANTVTDELPDDLFE
tara:strand:+ start:46662 stop:47105 length:444 start_codon:yes stop_codon:yes gene_type:complete